ncbi:MAG TPA: hypothetical protein HA230_02310 [Candidatus Aenigmarchaeota archaeon]|nr:hypothetical protein [Candidatus Aenigmarchaeota archaeon]
MAGDIFYKADFCRAVTGHTDSELRGIVSRDYIDPVTKSRGFDMPRSGGDVFVDRFALFMGTTFQFPLVDLPRDQLYEIFQRFRTYEEEVHPRREFSNHDAFYAPLYRDIEAAYQTGDVEELKGAISALVDGIVHD